MIDLKQAAADADQAKELSADIEIKTLDEYVHAANALVWCYARAAEIEEARLEKTKPIRQQLDAVNEEYVSGKVFGEAVASIKAAMAEFVDQRLREALAAAQAAAVTGNRWGVHSALRPVPNIPGVDLRTVKELVIEDEGALPPEMIKSVPNTAAIKEALKKNLVVPGARQQEKTQVAVVLGRVGEE